jgi:transglutaminase-like putative cysteine protease
MRYRITHRTAYQYSAAVARSMHVLHLGPRPFANQRLVLHDLTITPVPTQRRDLIDYFGNPVAIVSIEESHRNLEITATSAVDVTPPQKLAFGNSPAWEEVREAMRRPQQAKVSELTCYSPFTRPSREIRDYAARSFPPRRPLLEGVADLTKRINKDFAYQSGATDVHSSVDEVFTLRRGVCQDFAHLELACLRALGLPARYVSGYLRTFAPAGQARLVGADASHAWIAAWTPQEEWVGFDPTNNLVVGDEHIAIACGRDFVDVSPVSGVILGGGKHFVAVSVDVAPL